MIVDGPNDFAACTEKLQIMGETHVIMGSSRQLPKVDKNMEK